MADESASLDDVVDEIEAAADLMNERLRRIEKNTNSMAFWVKFMGIVLLLSLIGTFVTFISIQG